MAGHITDTLCWGLEGTADTSEEMATVLHSSINQYSLQLIVVLLLLLLLIIILLLLSLLLLLLLLSLLLLSLDLGGLLLVGSLLLLLLGLSEGLESLGGVLLGLLNRVGDDHVREDGTGLHLPEVESDGSPRLVEVQLVIGSVLGVVNVGMDPLALVGGVLDLLGLPLSLVLGVVNHGRFPLSVHLIIPVVRLLRVLVGNVLGLLPVGGLLISLVIDVLSLVPVLGLLCIGVLDSLGGEHVPVRLEISALNLLSINLHLVRVVGVQDEGVQVSQNVVLKSDVLLDEVVLALVREDDVDLLGGSADIGTEHEVVGGLAVEVLQVGVSGHHLDVSSSAVDALLVLDGVLDNHGLAGVGEVLVELGGARVELGVLGGLDSLVSLLISVELAGGQLELSVVLLVLGLHPSLLPRSICKGLLEVDLGGDRSRERQSHQRELHSP
ncbi:hypothetical protein PFISCL1PPCAC_507 [Pristionchus fissidentatus]|uniref:Uncharacterized protein n=1 Tax=Pristionchus fissidentatus TaxID=1538716 RepID=A0AAV5UUL4_9BILA|nr:hypothetical protein PFISCL1PPCAC_507 [Pristionchus fissidentatus]